MEGIELTLMLRFLHCRQEREGGPQYTMVLVVNGVDDRGSGGFRHAGA